VLGTQFQVSNTDTMTDMLASDVGALIGALLAMTLYCHWLRTEQRERLGGVAIWLSDGRAVCWIDMVRHHACGDGDHRPGRGCTVVRRSARARPVDFLTRHAS